MDYSLFTFSWFDLFFFINILLVFSVIFLEKKNASTTWAWIMVMLFIPILGFILYLFAGQDLRKRKTFSKKAEADCFASIAHRQKISLNHKLNDFTNPLINPYKDLINLHLTAHDSLYTEDNNIEIFTDGNELFKSIFKTLNSAKEYIYIEYYIIHDDKLGNLFQELLIKKALQGIEVFLLYDDMGSIQTSQKYFRELKQAGVQIASFFPSFLPFVKLHANYRNHRKICVIDGHTAYVGGFNVGEEYLGLNKKFGYWRDTHMRITGTAVRLINLQFLLDRRFATKENLNLEKYIPTPTKTSSGNIGMQIVSSGPDSKYPSIRNGFIKMINAAKTSIHIQTPYFIPDEGVLTALKIAVLSGINVHIMIPNKPDHMFVYWATFANIGELVACGARCYTYENGFLHAKTIVIDNTISSVGTANLDIRSFKLNFEINAFIYNEEFSKQLVTIFNNDLEYCKEITKDLYNNRSHLIKFKESISRLISPVL